MPRTTSIILIVYYFEALHKQLSEKNDFSLSKCLMINECFWKAGITIPGDVSQKRQIVGGLSKLPFSCREKHRYHFVRKTYEQHLRQLEKFHFNCVVLNLDLLNNKKINFSRLGFVRKARLIAAAIFKLINGHISWLQFNIEWSVYD